jgi:hypothetical protein
MSTYDERHLARILAALPPAPSPWVQAAQELPSARSELDTLVARAAADGELRRALVSDLEAALEREGVQPTPALVRLLRGRLSSPGA